MTSSANLDIVISAINQTNQTLKQIRGDLIGLDAPAQKASSSLGGLQRVVSAGFALEGLREATGFLTSSAKAAAEDVASQVRLRTAIENTGSSWGSYAEQISAAIKNGQRLGFTDDQTRSALAILTAETDSGSEALRRYVLAQNLARGADLDVVTAARLLGKVNDENTRVLARYGIQVQKGATETELLDAVNSKFHGQADAFAETTAGKYAALNDRVHELKESFGALVIPVANPIIEGLTDSVKGWEIILHGAAAGFKDVENGAAGAFNQVKNVDKVFGLLVSGKASVNNIVAAFKSGEPDVDAYAKRLKELGETEAEDLSPTQLLEQAIAREAKAAADAAAEHGRLVDAQKKAILASEDQKKIATEANLALGKQVDSQGNVIASMSELVAKEGDAARSAAAAKQARLEYARANGIAVDSDGNRLATLGELITKEYEGAAASRLQKEAQAEYNREQGIAVDSQGNALPTLAELVARQYDSANATRMEKEALAEYNRERGIATDLEGNAIPTMQELVNVQLDSVNASIRQSQAQRLVAQQSFPQLVEQQKQSILASLEMKKAMEEANRELGITSDYADHASASIKQVTQAMSEVPKHTPGPGAKGINQVVYFGTRADGGPVSAGQPYLVGERGPELYVPERSGSIVSNQTLNNHSQRQTFFGTTVNIFNGGSDYEPLLLRF